MTYLIRLKTDPKLILKKYTHVLKRKLPMYYPSVKLQS